MDIDKEIIENTLKDFSVYLYDTTDSTNIRAREIAKENQGNIIVCANEQTDGRGRHGKSFFSPKDTGLYFSAVIHQEQAGTAITCKTAVALCRAIELVTDLKPQIKWVNDIYIYEKKVAGILVQAIENGRYVIGIGINILTENFPDEIEASASSLGVNVDKNILICETVKNILDLKKEDFVEEYRKKSFLIGKEIEYCQNNIMHNALVIDVDKNCGLVVNENQSIKVLTSGEISIKRR
ncbi:MAG: biotin--[acetyl-CoA-carboxylase] ligase [Ruminococcus sp.]|nr:biotin--[acetyl-CoA-carboxylase] ligase [Candidatus Copronaster equi]